MDGVLIDSEDAHDLVHKTLVKNLVSSQKNEPLCGDVEPGVSVTACYRRLLAANGFSGGMDATLENLHKKHFDEMIRMLYAGDIALCTSVAQLLPELYEKDIFLAIASSSISDFVHAVLSYFDIARYFSVIVSGEQVKRKKPAPDIYRTAVAMLGTSPQHTLAIEDSASGVASAASAGLRCLWYQPGEKAMPAGAYARIQSMIQVLNYIE